MSKRFLTVLILILSGLAFAGAAYVYLQSDAPIYQGTAAPNPSTPAVDKSNLVRFHSPSFGPAAASVTIVEFFDPSCEACRAFYPIVKSMMAKHPEDTRLVLRYVLNHPGSEEASRLIEAARKQNLFVPVIEAVLDAQPAWHDDPQIIAAWDAAEQAGLDVEKAREQMMSPDITAALEKDTADAQRLGVRGTPMFFVNGRPLTQFGAQPLYDLIKTEVAQNR
ncbi:DsbA family protein [Pseudomonas sp. Marseille-QA0892]